MASYISQAFNFETPNFETSNFETAAQLRVMMSSIRISSSDSLTSLAIPSPLLSEAVSFQYEGFSKFPFPLAAAIWSAVGATFNATDGGGNYSLPIVPCSFLNNQSTIDITFKRSSDVVVSVPMFALTKHNGTGAGDDQGPYATACKFMIGARDSNTSGSSISTAFLRRMYTVFDQQNYIFSIALLANASQGGIIIEIPPGGIAAIPASALLRNGNSSTTSPSSLPSSPESTQHSRALTIGVSVGLGLGIPLLITCCVVLFWFQRRSRTKTKTKTPETTISELIGPDASYRHSELPGEIEPMLVTTGKDDAGQNDQVPADGKNEKHELAAPEL